MFVGAKEIFNILAPTGPIFPLVDSVFPNLWAAISVDAGFRQTKSLFDTPQPIPTEIDALGNGNRSFVPTMN